MFQSKVTQSSLAEMSMEQNSIWKHCASTKQPAAVKLPIDRIEVDPITMAVFAQVGDSQYANTDDESSEQVSDVSIGDDTVKSRGNVREAELDTEAMCFYQVANFRLGRAYNQ